MKRKIDFIIKEDISERIIFRFYPRQSSCHSFNDIPPKTWEEVYKVYYSYSILKQYKFNSDDNWESVIVFQESCDECSIIDDVGFVCVELSKDKKYKMINEKKKKYLNNPIFPIGIGTEWIIEEKNNYDYYKFYLFSYNNIGYRFYLHKDKMKTFGKYLEYCCEYMLEHGCGI